MLSTSQEICLEGWLYCYATLASIPMLSTQIGTISASKPIHQLFPLNLILMTPPIFDFEIPRLWRIDRQRLRFDITIVNTDNDQL